MGKKIYHLDLQAEDRVFLENIAKRRKSESEMNKRSLMLLAADRQGEKKWTASEISEHYKVNGRTVERLRERFVLHGIDIALSGLPQPSEDKIKFDRVVESHLVGLRCRHPPTPYSSWTLSLLAESTTCCGSKSITYRVMPKHL